MVKAFMPETLDECLDLMSKHDLRIVAGGTDMLIQNRAKSSLPIGYKSDVIYLKQIRELENIVENDDYIYIGANVSLERIMSYASTPKLLKDTILEMASPGIRNTATLAGNIGNASPAGDSLVPLYLLDTQLEIRSFNIIRRCYLKDFIIGVRKIDLDKSEIITNVIIPKISFTFSHFRKVGPRLSDAISKVSFAGAYTIENGSVRDFRVAFGAVSMTVVRDNGNESKIIGKSVDEVISMRNSIKDLFDSLIKPIDDQRSNKVYRKEIALNLLDEFIDIMLKDLG